MYGDFARVYDRLMRDVDYAGWAEYYASLLDMSGVPADGLVAECACGTGSLTLPLSVRYRMTGVDISQEMLSVAADKLRAAGRQVPLIRQDMQRLRLHRPQDAVLCTCDGVNYLTDDKALGHFLAAAHAALKPGGALAFDVSSLHKLRTTLGDNTLTNTEGDVHYIWHNAWDERERLLRMRLYLYARQAGNAWALIEEEQVQRGYDEAALTRALQAAGFDDIRIFGDWHLNAPGPQEPRLHVLARKPI